MSSLDGVLPVDKPPGPTSHDIVATARRALGLRRIGHTGTLDPFASGLLLLCLGPATRLAEYLTGLPKSYTATLRLGEATDTDDLEGTVIARSEGWQSLARDEIEAAFRAQTGERMQLPPRYSAKKVAGERMYAVARKGGEVAREPVPVRISRIEVIHFDPPEVVFEVDCSSGTYIRAIARDLGEALGTGAHLTALRRTAVGSFAVTRALSPGALGDSDAVAAALIQPAAALHHLPVAELTEPEVREISFGRSVAPREGSPGGPVALRSPAGTLVAIGEVRNGRLQPTKVFL